jgi:hypothetical protein
MVCFISSGCDLKRIRIGSSLESRWGYKSADVVIIYGFLLCIFA